MIVCVYIESTEAGRLVAWLEGMKYRRVARDEGGLTSRIVFFFLDFFLNGLHSNSSAVLNHSVFSVNASSGVGPIHVPTLLINPRFACDHAV